MDFIYKEEILQLHSFLPVFKELQEANPEIGQNIEEALRAAVRENHALLKAATSREQLQLALLKEQLLIQAQSSQYLSITDEISQKKNALLEFKPRVYNDFMDEVEKSIRQYFQLKSDLICHEIKADGSWYSGLRDSAKKGGGSLFNIALEGINSVTKNLAKTEVFDQEHLVDSKTIVETALEKHLSSEQISADIGTIFTTATKGYEQSWVEQIRLSKPNLKAISAFSIANSARAQLQVNFQLGQTEHVLAAGLGAAVVGAAGLAIGWHTLTYAMINVFPPIAIFAALATVATGFLTKESAVKKRQEEAKEVIDRYYQFFIQQLYTMEVESLGNKSISKYMDEVGEGIVRETVRQWENSYFETLTFEHFKKLNQAFVKHLMYVNEAIEEIDGFYN